MTLKLSIKNGWGIVTVVLCAGVLASCGANAEQDAGTQPTNAQPDTATKTEAAKTGLQVGESVSAFDVEDITGPKKGKQLCYV